MVVGGRNLYDIGADNVDLRHLPQHRKYLGRGRTAGDRRGLARLGDLSLEKKMRLIFARRLE